MKINAGSPLFTKESNAADVLNTARHACGTGAIHFYFLRWSLSANNIVERYVIRGTSDYSDSAFRDEKLLLVFEKA